MRGNSYAFSFRNEWENNFRTKEKANWERAFENMYCPFCKKNIISCKSEQKEGFKCWHNLERMKKRPLEVGWRICANLHIQQQQKSLKIRNYRRLRSPFD